MLKPIEKDSLIAGLETGSALDILTYATYSGDK
jgi:hypothetical protein